MSARDIPQHLVLLNIKTYNLITDHELCQQLLLGPFIKQRIPVFQHTKTLYKHINSQVDALHILQIISSQIVSIPQNVLFILYLKGSGAQSVTCQSNMKYAYIFKSSFIQ